MRLLVTGASGFLGSHLIQKLLEHNHHVSALVRKKGGDLPSSVRPLSGDITSLESLKAACKDQDVVFHLAAKIAADPRQHKSLYKVNVTGTQNVIAACLEHKVPLIYVSSIAAVGASYSAEILNEASPYKLEGLNMAYFNTKHEAEQHVLKACNEQGLKSIILNPSFIYGPKDALKSSRRVQSLIAQGKMPFYPAFGGVNIVDVHSVVSVLIQSLEKTCWGERFLISGDNISNKQLFQSIAKVAGVAVPFFPLTYWVMKSASVLGGWLGQENLNPEAAKMALLYHWFDNSKAKKEFDFNPLPFKESLKLSINWQKEWQKNRDLG